MNHALRKALDAISGPYGAVDPNHPEKVAALKAKFHHSIRYLCDGNECQQCFDYAFDIHPDLIRDARNGMIFHEFIQWYCNHELIEKVNGELVIYFNGDHANHVGVGREQIKSKWGLHPIYEHQIMELPESYGDKFKRYHVPPGRDAVLAYIEFVRRHSHYVDCLRFESSVTDLGLQSLPAW
jgi:hypothetical protein